MSPDAAAYPFFGIPPTRPPRPAAHERALRGKRVIVSTPDGFVYDMRAASEPYLAPDGRAMVDVVTEEGWYRWMLIGAQPERKAFSVKLLWVE